MKERRRKKNIIHEQRRLMVFAAGLNWIELEIIVPGELLASIPTWVAIDLGIRAIYPPPGLENDTNIEQKYR